MKQFLLAFLVLSAVPAFVIADDPATEEKKDEKKPAAEVADYKKLKEALPEKFGGLDRTSITGQRTKQGEISIATAEAKYGKDEGDAPKIVSINVVDYAGMAGWAEGLAMWEKMDMDQEGDEGFTKTDTINGHKVMMTYQTNDKRGTVQLLVNKRLLVNIEARNVTGDEIKAMAKEFDTTKLAAAAPEAK